MSEKTQHYVTKRVKVESIGAVNLVGRVESDGLFYGGPNEEIDINYWLRKFKEKRIRILIEDLSPLPDERDKNL